MVNKRHLHYIHRRLEPVSPWFFLCLLIVSVVVGVGALRQNNINMLKLREAVYAADKDDKDDKDVEAALRDLREYVHSHMNTDLSANSNGIYPPIQLKYRYERLVAAEKKRVSKANEAIYTRAQKYCEIRFPAGMSGSGRIPCIQNYVSERGEKEKTIPDALYKFDFVSPRWSSDLAGWSLVAAGFFLILFIVRLASEWWMRSEL